MLTKNNKPVSKLRTPDMKNYYGQNTRKRSTADYARLMHYRAEKIKGLKTCSVREPTRIWARSEHTKRTSVTGELSYASHIETEAE